MRENHNRIQILYDSLLEYVHGSAYYFQKENYSDQNIDYLIHKNLLDNDCTITAKGRTVISKLRNSKVPKGGYDKLKTKESDYLIKKIERIIDQETYDWDKGKNKI